MSGGTTDLQKIEEQKIRRRTLQEQKPKTEQNDECLKIYAEIHREYKDNDGEPFLYNSENNSTRYDYDDWRQIANDKKRDREYFCTLLKAFCKDQIHSQTGKKIFISCQDTLKK